MDVINGLRDTTVAEAGFEITDRRIELAALPADFACDQAAASD
jgi:hypothetical protein